MIQRHFDITATLHDGWCKLVKDSNGHEILITTDSAAILIYVKDRDAVLMITQSRMSQRSEENPEGLMYEFIAGRFDREVEPKALLVAEAWEEAGVLLEEDDILLINDGKPLAKSAGAMTEVMYLGYAEVQSLDGDDEAIYGLPHEHERIKRFIVPVTELETVPMNDLAAFALTQWFIKSRAASEVTQPT